MTELIMLGTGCAMVTECYNTCFALKNDDDVFLVDAGGGNGILTQLKKADIAITDIHNMFVTHAHTDHILGGDLGGALRGPGNEQGPLRRPLPPVLPRCDGGAADGFRPQAPPRQAGPAPGGTD